MRTQSPGSAPRRAGPGRFSARRTVVGEVRAAHPASCATLRNSPHPDTGETGARHTPSGSRLPPTRRTRVALLEVIDLHVAFPTEDGLVRAVQGMSFTLDRGQTLGIVGESGSGKSVSTQTILGLTRGAQITGQALFEGQDLLRMPKNDLRKIRGTKISTIFQDPLSSLHPHYRVGAQISEMIRAHESVSKADGHKRARDLLKLVGIPQPDRRVDDYPHQFSGGMRQRAMIAMAIALNPQLLIADEPTTALDVTTQSEVMALIDELRRARSLALLFITHDLDLAASVCDRTAVMYEGAIVEDRPSAELNADPRHPYSVKLIAARPSLTAPLRLGYSAAAPPEPSGDRVRGCARETLVGETPVREEASVRETSVGETPARGGPVLEGPARETPARETPVLAVSSLSKSFRVPGSDRRHIDLLAVQDISFELSAGSSLAIVGESGSGKTTI
ncbi:MAG TPA: ATP-binding cassette domain-containing protein, partial [Mycobacteriales bacterium]|nr:ATP-binding cassette domain-containing protein [Mycobacteriales bacterium]